MLCNTRWRAQTTNKANISMSPPLLLPASIWVIGHELWKWNFAMRYTPCIFRSCKIASDQLRNSGSEFLASERSAVKPPHVFGELKFIFSFSVSQSFPRYFKPAVSPKLIAQSCGAYEATWISTRLPSLLFPLCWITDFCNFHFGNTTVILISNKQSQCLLSAANRHKSITKQCDTGKNVSNSGLLQMSHFKWQVNLPLSCLS